MAMALVVTVATGYWLWSMGMGMATQDSSDDADKAGLDHKWASSAISAIYQLPSSAPLHITYTQATRG